MRGRCQRRCGGAQCRCRRAVPSRPRQDADQGCPRRLSDRRCLATRDLMASATPRRTQAQPVADRRSRTSRRRAAFAKSADMFELPAARNRFYVEADPAGRPQAPGIPAGEGPLEDLASAAGVAGGDEAQKGFAGAPRAIWLQLIALARPAFQRRCSTCPGDEPGARRTRRAGVRGRLAGARSEGARDPLAQPTPARRCWSSRSSPKLRPGERRTRASRAYNDVMRAVVTAASIRTRPWQRGRRGAAEP